MLSPSRWLARLRYKRRVKRLNKPFGAGITRVDANLIRADKNKPLEERLIKKKTTDIFGYPFVLPSGPQGHRRYALYDTFYCVFPSHEGPPTGGGYEEGILMAYSAWMNRSKTDHPLPTSLLETLGREDKSIVQEDTVTVLNHFFIFNKFAYGGYVISADEDDGDPTVTMIYYRSQPLESTGLMVDPNLFLLKESQKDTTTACQISDQWIGKIVDAVAVDQRVVDTDITNVPLNKTLYATVTALLKHAFITKPSHMVVN